MSDLDRQVLAVLRASRARIATADRWTQLWWARATPHFLRSPLLDREEWSSRSNRTTPSDRSAVCWCARGAIRAVMAEMGMQIDATFEAMVAAEMGFASAVELAAWNDARERTHAEVLARFDQAIAEG